MQSAGWKPPEMSCSLFGIQPRSVPVNPGSMMLTCLFPDDWTRFRPRHWERYGIAIINVVNNSDLLEEFKRMVSTRRITIINWVLSRDGGNETCHLNEKNNHGALFAFDSDHRSVDALLFCCIRFRASNTMKRSFVWVHVTSHKNRHIP